VAILSSKAQIGLELDALEISAHRTPDGDHQKFSDLTFQSVGIASAQLYREECLKYGILWLTHNAEQAPYRPLIYGLDAPPWALRSASSKAIMMDIKLNAETRCSSPVLHKDSGAFRPGFPPASPSEG
jgi:hypothetical protein